LKRGGSEPPGRRADGRGARLTLRIGERTVRTFTTVLHFDNAVEVTAPELRVEMVFPADEASDAFFREMVDARRG